MPTAPPLPFDGLAFDGTAADRRAALLARMADLTAHHRAQCDQRIKLGGVRQLTQLAQAAGREQQ